MRRAAVLLLLLHSACGEAPPSPGAASPPVPPPPGNYQGPRVSAGFVDGDLVVAVEAPTAGWQFGRDAVKPGADTADVELTLTSPGAEEAVAQVVTRVELRLPGGELAGARRARILVALVQRGASYLVAPAHELAAEAVRW